MRFFSPSLSIFLSMLMLSNSTKSTGIYIASVKKEIEPRIYRESLNKIIRLRGGEVKPKNIINILVYQY